MPKRLMTNYKLGSEPVEISRNAFYDNRGYFMESYNKKLVEDSIGMNINFVQDNTSKSRKGVIRGLHFQYVHPQNKLISVVNGSIIDVIVDLRAESSNFKKVYTYNLNDENRIQLFVPAGFAHGFISLQDDTIVTYKIDDIWYPEDEGGIIYNDPDLSLNWEKLSNIPFNQFIISSRDYSHPTLKTFLDNTEITL